MGRNRARRLAHPLPLPKDIVLCGELTLDPSQPHNNVLPFPKHLALDIRSAEILDIHNLRGTAVGADFGLQLMTFLIAQARALHLDQVEINVPRGAKYLVRNSETAFKKACGDADVRAWLEEHVINEGRKAAMIVGMYTYTNATYSQNHQNQLGGRASGSDPTSTVNLNVALGAAAEEIDQHAFNMPDEQIFAIEYKIVKFKPWTKKKVQEARLEDGQNRWEVFFGDRSKGAVANEKENIFEFNLDDGDADAADEDDETEEIEDQEGDEAAPSMRFRGSLPDDEI